MRQRKRADWLISVYRYGVRLEHQPWSHLPDAARQEIGAMRSLWNQLVDAFEQRQAQYQVIFAQLPQITELRGKVTALQHQIQQAAASYKRARQRLQRLTHPELVSLAETKNQLQKTLQEAKTALRVAQHEAAETVRPALHQLQRSFWAETQRLRTTSSATWANREFILTQFLAAVERSFKTHNSPPKRKEGEPREVHFHHRFTDGGLPVERLFGRGQRVHLEPVPPEAFQPALPQRQRKRLARTTGTFQVGETTLSFHTILHRPLPEGAYLKAAALVGQQVMRGGYRRYRDGGHLIPARWTWSLQLTLELPPPVVPAQERDRPVAALELACQVQGDSHLRIGVLVDSTGREEALFLPQDILTAGSTGARCKAKPISFWKKRRRACKACALSSSCRAPHTVFSLT
jgi:hypothetical protein